jgi:cytochrome c
MRRILCVFALLGLAAGAASLLPDGAARGEAPGDQAMRAALRRGQELWNQVWATNQKSCATCHNAGPNKLIGVRVKAYPKWDKSMDRVVSAQQKLNQMIVEKALGKPLELGSDDLNALEAYVSGLR